MPASVCDSVSNALHLSLAEESQNSSLLDSRLYSSVKSVLLTKIDFEESGDYQSNVLDGLKSKYVVIRPTKHQVIESNIHKKDGCNGNYSEAGKNAEEVLPKPKRILYPIENIEIGYQGSWSAGAGMHNVGNTCYLNSTLQALFHVPSFVNWLASEATHAEKCNQQEACVICGMYATLIATQKSGGNPIKPWQVYSKLRLICRQLTPGRQEDAHEFLRYLVEAMEKCYLSRFINADKLDQYSKETTPLNQIFGGYLRSTVRCLTCHHLSTTFQHVQDLFLDIRKHSTLDEALDSFFSKEKLEDLGYKCEACDKKVSAIKQFYVEKAPTVLCIALKRFSLAGGKLSKHLQFRKKINLAKYMYNKKSQQRVSYKLVSIVTHFGPSLNCGHYTALGQAPNGTYYQFDDSSMRSIPLSAVLSSNCYFMFYERDSPLDSVNIPAASSSMGIVYGPQLPESISNRAKSPLKLTFYKSDERKTILNNGSSETKSDSKPIILNSILDKSMVANNSEPWVVNQNGDIEKVSQRPKVLNGIDKGEDKKPMLINRNQNNNESNKVTVVGVKVQDRYSSINRVVKTSKSPLQKLEEQMNKNDLSHSVMRNGNTSKLVPYDSESSSDERDRYTEDRRKREVTTEPVQKPKPSRCESPQGLIITTKAMHSTWTVSQENNGLLMSPSLNGDTNKKLKEERRSENGNSPNTSVSSMSPLSDRSDVAAPVMPSALAAAPATAPAPVPAGASASPPAHAAPMETARHLHGLSHRGYGAPVSTWGGTHSNMSRQVYEERREERKRALEATDDMDRGRSKKIKKFHHYNRFNNNRNGYNPFQEKQNKQQWGHGFKYRGERRSNHHFNKHNGNKYKRFNRYSNGHHYPRHH